MRNLELKVDPIRVVTNNIHIFCLAARKEKTDQTHPPFPSATAFNSTLDPPIPSSFRHSMGGNEKHVRLSREHSY